MTTTFGFEAEFDDNADAICAHIKAQDSKAIREPLLHRYHCDCSGCLIDPSMSRVYPFRGQTDSSCSGEIISMPFPNMDVARGYMQMLEQAACETDAIPGYASGFHVHVMINDDLAFRREAFFEFIRYEDPLRDIARGRFSVLRANNRSVRDDLVPLFEGILRDYGSMQDRRRGLYVDGGISAIRAMSPTNKIDYMEHVYRQHRGHDRHSNLNLRTRIGTWEFRLFNSTRSAWRMELFAWLSLAFNEPDFISYLASSSATDVTTIKAGLKAAKMKEALELLNKQLDYHEAIASGSKPYTDELVQL